MVDGDTIIVDGVGRVRLIGVDTPESVDPRRPVEHFAKEAARFTQQLVEGKRVRLEDDGPRTDRYDRTLAYVFLEDGTFVNAEIIRQGIRLRLHGVSVPIPRRIPPVGTRGPRERPRTVGRRRPFRRHPCADARPAPIR